MGSPSRQDSNIPAPNARRPVDFGNSSVLNSWKEIARYLGRGVRTVQRWEQNYGLPVHRPKGRERGATLALTAELDQWLHQTSVRSAGNSNGHDRASGAQISSGGRFIVPAAGPALVARLPQRNQLILSVDDDPALLFLREQLLKAEGFLAVSAANGKEALALFATSPVDLVLLDFQMPGINGGVVAQRMKAQKPLVPIIMVSGHPLPSEMLTYVERVVPKGEGPKCLLTTIDECLMKRAAR